MTMLADVKTVQGEMEHVISTCESGHPLNADDLRDEVSRIAAGTLQLSRVVEALVDIADKRAIVVDDIEPLANAHERAMDSAARDIRDALSDGLTKLAGALER